jgi:CheY-like chemotaxis protein
MDAAMSSARRILIADDRPESCKAARSALEAEGFLIRCAYDGSAVTQELDAFRPHLLLLSMTLTGGLALARTLKSTAATRHLCIVAVAVDGRPGDRDRALAAGCDGVLERSSDAGMAALLRPYLARAASERPGLPRRGRVLIVDDDPLICSFISRTLTQEHDVTVFHSARDALTCLERGERFDVILCDMMMPVVTGMDFYERLSQAGDQHAARIIFLTGGTFSARASEFLETVSNARLEKPFSLKGLRAIVNEQVV